ncbi:MAG: PadR family transcriptional regulator [Dermatophilaceae bacterium]
MRTVFAHGQLRLYMLRLLEQGPMHGYEVIRDLQTRFNGLYSPSAGTIYPRLAKLQELGLVEHSKQGRKTTYRLTSAGALELDSRRDELDALDASLAESARRLAREVPRRVHDGPELLRAILITQDEARDRVSPDPVVPMGENGDERRGPASPGDGGATGSVELLVGRLVVALIHDQESVRHLLALIAGFGSDPHGQDAPKATGDETSDHSGHAYAAAPSAEQLGDVAEILRATFHLIREVLETPSP